MQKIKKKSESQIEQLKNFPTLRKASSVVKPVFSLTKIELDSNVTGFEQTNAKNANRELMTSFAHKRVLTGIGSRSLAQNQFMKTSRANFHEVKFQKDRQSTMSNHNSAIMKESERPSQQLMIDKAKVSTKQIGQIKAYSVNSHSGPLNTINEDRICIVTNLNRTTIVENQISFFSIFDGKNGSQKAEYFRDNFHTLLSKDKQFYKDIQKSIRRAYITTQQNFAKNSNANASCETSVAIIISFAQTVIYVHTGDSKIVASYNLGAEIVNPALASRQSLKYSNKKNEGSDVIIRRMSTVGLDFIVLGSEGLFENLSEKKIGAKIWESLVRQKHENIHMALGTTTNYIINLAFSQMSTKNVSIILMSFENVSECFKSDSNLDLPYVQSMEAVSILE